MVEERGEALRRVWWVVPRVAGGVASVPVVIGFVVAGVVVVVGRELRDLVRDVWPRRAGEASEADPARRSDAA